MLQLLDLAPEVPDVLGGVGVIELTLDLPFFLLWAEHNRGSSPFYTPHCKNRPCRSAERRKL